MKLLFCHTNLFQRAMTVSPNSVGLASFDETYVAAKKTDRTRVTSEGESDAGELKAAHDKVAELQALAADKDKLLRKRRKEVTKAKQELEKEKENSKKHVQASEALKVSLGLLM